MAAVALRFITRPEVPRVVVVLTQRLFLKFSELQLWEDGVSTISRHRDAIDVAVRESTGLVSEPLQFRECRSTQAARGALGQGSLQGLSGGM